MRGVETRIQEIRHRIFREVARMAYHTEWQVDKRIEELPYEIVPGEVGNFRNDIFLERAIVGERLRLAMGLPYRLSLIHISSVCTTGMLHRISGAIESTTCPVSRISVIETVPRYLPASSTTSSVSTLRRCIRLIHSLTPRPCSTV